MADTSSLFPAEALTQANFATFMQEKLYYTWLDMSEEFTTWAEANPGETDYIDKYDGAVFVMRIDQRFISIWPEAAYEDDGTTPKFFQYITKYSGGCFSDISSGNGGFCLLEDSDADFDTNPDRLALYLYVENPCECTDTGNPDCITGPLADCANQLPDEPNPTVYTQNNTNRAMGFYRITEDDFTTFRNSWDDPLYEH